MRAFLVSLLLLILSFASRADRGSYKIRTDKQGNIYAIGHFEGRITLDSISLGDPVILPWTPPGSYYFLAKFSSTGGLVWAKNLGEDINANCLDFCPNMVDMEVDCDNNIVLALSIISWTDGTFHPEIVKLDSNGTTVWSQTIGGWTDEPVNITIDKNDNIYFASTFSTYVVAGQDTLLANAPGATKTFVIKMTPTGDIIWMQKIHSDTTPVAHGNQGCTFIRVDTIGNSYVGGAVDGGVSFGNETYSYSGGYPFLAVIDSNGNAVRLRAYDTKGSSSMFTCATVSQANTLFLGGRFRDTTVVSPAVSVIAYPNQEIFYVGKTDKISGNADWARYNTINSLWTSTIAVASDQQNHVYGLGAPAESGIMIDNQLLAPAVPAYYLSSAFVTHFDSSGNLLCYYADTTYLNDITVNDSNFYTIGIDKGQPFGQLWNRNIQITCWSKNNCNIEWRKNLIETTPIISSVNEPAHQRFGIYPNPSASGIFAISKSGNTEKVHIDIYDVNGRKVVSDHHGDTINISAFPKGLYFFRIQTGNEIETGKIIYQ